MALQLIYFVLTLATGYLTYFLFYHLYYKRRGLPPGPTPLPFAGNLLTLNRYAPGEAAFLKWRREYGPIYTYWQGEVPVVCVCEYEKIVELFQRDGGAYSGRGGFSAKEQGKPPRFGLFGTDGELWSEHRHFTVRAFKELGVGGKGMEEMILEEISGLIARLNTAIDSSPTSDSCRLDIAPLVRLTVGSIINHLLFGRGYTQENEHEFHSVESALRNMHVATSADPRMSLLFGNAPTLNWLLPGFGRLRETLQRESARIKAHASAQVEEHLTSGAPEGVGEDYVSLYLREKERRDASAGESQHSFSIEQLQGACFDMWIGGGDPSPVIIWGIAHILHCPESIMQRLYAELDSNIGSRLVTMNDKQQLPLVNAFVLESLRIANTVPQNIPHTLTRDTVVNGYALKRGTIVVPQLSAVLYDPEVFPEPTRFNPDRFIDANGEFQHCDEVIHFSVGKRRCPGEGLAKMELFLLFANLLNQFKFSSRSSDLLPSLVRKRAMNVKCDPFKCRVERRQFC